MTIGGANSVLSAQNAVIYPFSEVGVGNNPHEIGNLIIEGEKQSDKIEAASESPRMEK